MNLHSFVGLGQADTPLAQLDRVRLQVPNGVDQNFKQVLPVEHHMARSVALHRSLTEVEPVPGLARSPVAQLSFRKVDLHAPERVLESQRVENAGSVRTDLDACSNLLERYGLFIDIDINPAP